MLNVNNVLPTPFKVKKMKKFTSMNVLSWKQRSKKNRKKENIFQNKFVSSQKHRMKKQEGATAAASPTFSLAKQRWLVS